MVKVSVDRESPFQRKAMALLNKLSPDNSGTIAEQMVDEVEQLGQDEDQLRVFSRMIFAKAVKEDAFRRLYADLCSVLQERWAEMPEEREAESRFASMLMANFDSAFEEVFDGSKVFDLVSDDLFVAKDARMDIMGTAVLYCQLFARGLVQPAAFDRVASLFLHDAAGAAKGAAGDDVAAVNEALAEAACQLVHSIGPFLDSSENQAYKDMLERYMTGLAEVCQNSGTKRIRFMYQDLAEARKSGWSNADGGFYAQKRSAKTKQQVRQEHEAKFGSAQQQDASLQQEEDECTRRLKFPPRPKAKRGDGPDFRTNNQGLYG